LFHHLLLRPDKNDSNILIWVPIVDSRSDRLLYIVAMILRNSQITLILKSYAWYDCCTEDGFLTSSFTCVAATHSNCSISNCYFSHLTLYSTHQSEHFYISMNGKIPH
jgi:hypothetical protein